VKPDKPDTERYACRTAFLAASKYYALAAVTHACLALVSSLPFVQGAFMRLAWRLGPWPSFPIPYELEARVSWPSYSEVPVLVVCSLAMVYLLALVVCLFHGLSFAAAVAAHRVLGHPRYWPGVRQRINLPAAWVVSIRRCWWIWPVGQSVSLLLDGMAWGFQAGFNPIIATGVEYELLRAVAIGLLFAAVTSRVLRAFVVEAVGPDDLRCGRCAYLLRGLSLLRCPECGYEGNLGGAVIYGLLWRDSGRWRVSRRMLLPLLVVVLFSSSVWWPMGVASIPRDWLRLAPVPIRLEVRDPNAFPIRSDAVVVVKRGDAVGIVRLQKKSIVRSDYEVLYWSDAKGMEPSSPPDSRSSGRLTYGGQPDLRIGPWGFRWMFLGVFEEPVIWLTRPDQTCSVEAFEPQSLPAHLQWLESWRDAQPMTPESRSAANPSASGP